MDPAKFRHDLDQIPHTLVDLASRLDHDTQMLDPIVAPLRNDQVRRVVLLGMGSSYSAAGVIAPRLRSAGVDAVAERSSAVAEGVGRRPDAETLVIAVSAGGGSIETLDALDSIGEHAPASARPAATEHLIALTNTTSSALTERTGRVIEMHAGVEIGGVACRTYRHTLAVLMAAVELLTTGETRRTVTALRRAAAATAHLLDRSDAWLPEIVDVLDTADGTWLLAPSARLSSAEQGALMIREGPRRRADACETGDWSHIDVYLTKTLDYRAIVHCGSRYDSAAADWMTQRGSTVVAVGGSFPGARHELRYPADDDTDVALLTEVLVAETIAAHWWSAGADG